MRDAEFVQARDPGFEFGAGRTSERHVIQPGPVDTDMMKGARMPLQPPAESVGKVSAIIDRLDVASTGKFWDYQGGQLAW